jgi:hypothetical protein
MSAGIEIVEPLDREDAKRLDKRIRLLYGSIKDNFDKLRELVDEAKRGEVHKALGLPSWPAYLADVFGEAPLGLKGDARKKLVSYLSGEGMSQRAIAPVVGASQMTVSRDLAATETNDSVDTTTMNGKTFKRKSAKPADAKPPPSTDDGPTERTEPDDDEHWVELIRAALDRSKGGVTAAREHLTQAKQQHPEVDFSELESLVSQRESEVLQLLQDVDDEDATEDTTPEPVVVEPVQPDDDDNEDDDDEDTPPDIPEPPDAVQVDHWYRIGPDKAWARSVIVWSWQGGPVGGHYDVFVEGYQDASGTLGQWQMEIDGSPLYPRPDEARAYAQAVLEAADELEARTR